MRKKRNYQEEVDFELPDDVTSLSEDHQRILRECLSDQEWRIENLYWVTDEDGNRVKFKLRPQQRTILKNRWYRNIILKARQLGMTTFLAIFFLDSVLFSENQKALIIAHTIDDARKIFDTKIKFAFDNLPEWLRSQFDVDTKNSNQLKFRNNGGSIDVDTSGRSGTFQFLHISEFGIICNKWPEKATEIVTGAFPTVHNNGLLFIESTAKGRSGYFYDYCTKAINLRNAKRELTNKDWKFFFFPWYEDPKYVVSGNVVWGQDLDEYFDLLKKLHGIELTKEQKSWYAVTKDTYGEEMFSEYPTTEEEAFKASIEGAYFTKQMAQAYADKRITTVPHDKSLLVYTFWDIGVGDETVIWFVQFFGNQIRLIDLYYANGESLYHYANILQQKAMENGYIYARHYAPHDIEVREIGNETAKSRKEIAASIGLRFDVVKRHPIDAGIDEMRAMFGLCWFDEKKCEKGLSALQEYRKEFDEKNGVWRSKPLHNWASHFADAFRQLGVTYKSIVIGGFELMNVRDPDMPSNNLSDNSTSFDPHAPLGGAF